MTVRIDVTEEVIVEISHYVDGRQSAQPYKYDNLISAVSCIRFLVKKDMEKAAKDRFIPQLHKEAQKAFKSLEEKSPYGQKG